MTGGWFIGDFDPSVYKTKDFEVAIATHKRGQKWPTHFHKVGVEINVLLEGKMKIQDQYIEAGDIFVIDPWEIADPIFLEDCKVVIVKYPSDPKDKNIIKILEDH